MMRSDDSGECPSPTAGRVSNGEGKNLDLELNSVRIALANIRYAESPEESVALACQAIAEASRAGAEVICFPECYVPGYRGLGHEPPPPDAAFLERAWRDIAKASGQASVGVVLGTERIVDGSLLATVLVIDRDGSLAGFQDKVQIDPSEDGLYTPGNGRRVFQAGPLTFGVAICHEGWRYPETVRRAARHSAAFSWNVFDGWAKL